MADTVLENGRNRKPKWYLYFEFDSDWNKVGRYSMKVNYYFRNPDPGNFSIENIFHTVQDELKNDIEKNNFF
ncbi:MAG: hypothetical protein ACKPFK_34530, partial [Dolichospermum sp.]